MAVPPLLTCLAATGCGGGAAAPRAAPAPPVSAAAPSAEAGLGATSPAVSASRMAPTATPATFRYAFPVRARNVDYHRTHSGYPATDIFANCGEQVVAVTDGTILEVSLVDGFDKSRPLGPYNGGKSVSLLGDDGGRYYGSHLTDVAADVRAGVRVRAGQSIGTVGRTGNANNVCHLHFGISPPCRRTGDWWIRRGVVWPWPYLDAWRKEVDRPPAAAVGTWRRTHGCPSAP